MAKNEHHGTMRIVVHEGEPYLESRFRAVDDTADGPIPRGKILVVRTSLLAPGMEDVVTELIDDDGSVEAFCPACAAEGHDPEEVLPSMRSGIPFVGSRKNGRNDPCPCGSGKKYKRCCLH